jgi:excisionase family DNA binding protein
MTASPLDAAMDAMNSQPTISVEQARLILGVSDDVCRKAIDAGKIEHLRLGRNIRVLSTPLKRKVGLMS